MPALYHDCFGTRARYVVWASTEGVEALAEGLPPAWRQTASVHPYRQRETLGAKRALLSLAPELVRRTIGKDAHGKPQLSGEPPVYFSLSHSRGHAAALIAERACGVDLQLRDEKILRLRRKFERPDERDFVRSHASEIDGLHVLWGAKESLYKLWGLRGLDWTRDMTVRAPRRATRDGGTFRGEVRHAGALVTAELAWRWAGDYCLVGAWRAD